MLYYQTSKPIPNSRQVNYVIDDDDDYNDVDSNKKAMYIRIVIRNQQIRWLAYRSNRNLCYYNTQNISRASKLIKNTVT